MKPKRVKVGTSHEGKYSYWLDSGDLYVYQTDETTGTNCGYLCSLDAWERTFSKASWMNVRG